VTIRPIDSEALLCALVLAPRTFSRNRFFSLYEDPAIRRTWRRAARVRGIIRQLSEEGSRGAEVLGEQLLADGRTLIRYRVEHLGFTRTTALSRIEAALVRYALHLARNSPLETADRLEVQQALSRLADGLAIAETGTRPARTSSPPLGDEEP
jgi:hypothetical protein